MTEIAARPSVGAAAVQLRVSGASFADIAMTLGLRNAKAALKAVTDELSEQGEKDEDKRERLRAETNMALDSMLQGLYDKAHDPADPEHLPAIRTAVTLLDRRARLNGLDAATEVLVHTPTQTEMDQWVASIVQRSMPTVQEADTDEMLGIIDVESVEADA